MRHAIVFHPQLFNKKTGSSEKLLQDIARILADSGEFIVWCVYGDCGEELAISEGFSAHPSMRLSPFAYVRIRSKPPWKPVGMFPRLDEIMADAGQCIFICLVSSGDQWPITSLPAEVPMLLISPFGDFCSNGNVRRLYVSGAGNVSKLKRIGIDFAENFFNPLKIPAKRPATTGSPVGPVVLGRVGRADSVIFDPISLYAFARLEEEFGDEVSYIYVNPPKEARDLASQLGLRQIRFQDWISPEALEDLYESVDILAHARKDGETLGVAIAEAMLHQCVVVSHRSAFFNEHLFLLREPFGLVADLNDIDEYYRHLKQFVVNRDKLGDFGQQARAFASAYFDRDVVGRKIVSDCLDLWNFVGKPLPAGVRLRHGWLRFEFWLGVVGRKLGRIASNAISQFR